MSANDYYWAKAQSGSPGTNLAEMQARLYAGETTQRMMEKFDHKLQTFTMGISDPTELDAAQQRAQALLTEKMAIANRFSSQSESETRSAVIKLVIKAGIKPDRDTVRRAGGLMARRLLLTAVATRRRWLGSRGNGGAGALRSSRGPWRPGGSYSARRLVPGY